MALVNDDSSDNNDNKKDYKSTIKEKQAEAKRLMTREQLYKCRVVIHTAAVASAASGAIPIPVADAIPISAAQITMIISLGKIFDQKITKAVAEGIGKATAATLVGRGIIKFIPIIGWGISAAVAAGITEAIGWETAVEMALRYNMERDIKAYADDPTDSDIEYYNPTTYVCADIHGNMEAFQDILCQIDFQPTDELYILGDVIDHGKDGIEILRWVMEHQSNVHMLLGNHEYMMLDALGHPREDREQDDPLGLWYYNGGEATHNDFNKLSKNEQDQILDYLSSIPTEFDITVNGIKYKLVHANAESIWKELYSNKSVKDPMEYFCVWDRVFTQRLTTLGPDMRVIFGHTPTIHLQKGIIPIAIYRNNNIIGIDTGAAYPDLGGRLACIRLEDEHVFYSRR